MAGGSTFRLGVVLALALGVVSVPKAHAGAIFDFQVDRFEFARPSAPPYVDDFSADKNVWTHLYGTAVIVDGFLHLSSPGTTLPNAFGVLPGTTLDISAVLFNTALTPVDGSFTTRSSWVPDELVFGDFNHMSLVGNDGTTSEVVGIALSNATPTGQPVQYQIDQHRVLVDPNGVVSHFDNVLIDPNSITGEVVFSLAFDGASKTVQTAISLDGGTTFQTPFTPQPFFTAVPHAQVMLGADPLTDTQRPPMPLCTGGARIESGMVVVRKHGTRLIVRGTVARSAKIPQMPEWPKDGLQFRIADTASGTPLLDLTGTSAIPSKGRCQRGDGWTTRGRVSVYRNVSGGIPPGCEAGSAQGLRKLTMRTGRKAYRFNALVQPVSIEPLSAVGVTLVLGTSPVVGDSGRCGTLDSSCVQRPATTRCH